MPPFRPRLAFSLRTLFVLITIAALGVGWFGRQWHIFAQRKALLSWIELKGGGVTYFTTSASPGELAEFRASELKQLGYVRVILGDYTIHSVYLSEASESAADEVRRLFPEAQIYDY